jgi:hypothetical protein
MTEDNGNAKVGYVDVVAVVLLVPLFYCETETSA